MLVLGTLGVNAMGPNGDSGMTGVEAGFTLDGIADWSRRDEFSVSVIIAGEVAGLGWNTSECEMLVLGEIFCEIVGTTGIFRPELTVFIFSGLFVGEDISDS